MPLCGFVGIFVLFPLCVCPLSIVLSPIFRSSVPFGANNKATAVYSRRESDPFEGSAIFETTLVRLNYLPRWKIGAKLHSPIVFLYNCDNYVAPHSDRFSYSKKLHSIERGVHHQIYQKGGSRSKKGIGLYVKQEGDEGGACS